MVGEKVIGLISEFVKKKIYKLVNLIFIGSDFA